MFTDYRIGNRRIRATITQPKQMAGGFLTPVKSLIHMPVGTRIADGSILYEGSRALYILAYHHQLPQAVVFTGVEINTQVDVAESKVTTNTVTNMKEKREIGPATKVYACEQLVTATDVVGLKNPEKVYYLPTPVTSDHFINTLRVRNVIPVGGIYRVEVG